MNKMENTKRVFISYSHDSDLHREWVRGLAEYLLKNGIDVVLDQWDVELGDDLAAFMESAIRHTDRVLAICTDGYVDKANGGVGGVGYEKTIATAEILRNPASRRRFIPVVRNVAGEAKLPAFFGAAYYLDLSDGVDTADRRYQLVRSVSEVPHIKPALGASPFIPPQGPPQDRQAEAGGVRLLGGREAIVEFSDRFGSAFPGLRGVQWFEDADVISERLDILLRQPLSFQEGHVAGWWRGPSNLHIESFERVEGSHFLLDVEELNIRRIAAVNPGIYYRKFVYVESGPDKPTGLYPVTEEDIALQVEAFGYANEEYGLLDDKVPVTRAEYDDGAAIVNGKPVDILGRVALRVRYITPYNFLIAPFESPINNVAFDYELRGFLNDLLQGRDVFEKMCQSIIRLPKRN